MAQELYITVAEWAETTDIRILQRLSSDTGTPATADENNAILLNCIEVASAQVEQHTLRGGRHTIADLNALETDDDWTLKGLVANLATGQLYRRRGGDMPADIRARVDQAENTLNDLSNGAVIFRDSGAIAAGQADVFVINNGDRRSLRMVSDGPNFPIRLGSLV